MNVEPLAAAPSRARRAATPMLFLLLGVVYASWSSRIPAIRDQLGLTPSELGLVLLSGGIGAVASFPLAAWLVAHFGGRRASAWSGLALLLLVPMIALAPSMAWLALTIGLLGVATSCYDVGINVLAAEEEKSTGRAVMSKLHAWFCVGSFGGALFGSAMAALAWAPLPHFLLAVAAMAAMLAFSYRMLPCDQPDPNVQKKRFALPHGGLVALGLICFCGAIGEGSIANWSTLYMKDHMLASDGVAPLGYAAFNAMMLASRLLGDRMKTAYGARRMMVASSLAAACGIFVAVFAPSVPVAIAGFALAGAGVALVFPFIFSAAGRHGSNALTAVATMGYSGNLMGPPIVGFIAGGFGLQAALAFIGVLSIAVAIAASRARMLD